MSRLTSVANVKRYLAITSSTQDTLIDRLIPTESVVIERFTGRQFGYIAATSRRMNGSGSATLVLPEQPILSVASLTIDGTVIPASANGSCGYAFDDAALHLVRGGKFTRGVQNVAVTWSSGYKATENTTVPAGNTPTIQPLDYGFAMTAEAVSYTANGTAFAAAGTGNAPLVGQYGFADGIFSFNGSDANRPVTIAYGYVPADVEEAAIESVGLDLKQRDNLGVKSKSLAGESVTYASSAMSVGVRQTLLFYRLRTPCG